MQTPSTMATNSEDWSWHLVNGDSESETHSERAMSVHDGSRPQTPAVILMPDHEPPSPESERLADTLLGTPVPATVRTLMGSANRLQEVQADAAGASHGDHAAEELEAAHHQVASGLSPGGEETVGVHCLQALSQEGSLEGFSAAAEEVAAAAAGAAGDGAGSRPDGSSLAMRSSEIVAAADKERSRASEDGGSSNSSPWQGMDEQQLEEMDEGLGLRWLLDLCSNGLTHLGNDLVGLHRTLATATARALARVTGGAAAAGSSSSDQMDEDAIAGVKLKTTTADDGRSLRAVLRQCTGAAAERPGLLLSALGLSTLAATMCLGLVYYYMSRCRNLSAALQQRDKELARLMMKVLNLQEALQLPRAVTAGPIIRHTSHTGQLLSGLGYSMM